MNYYEILGVSEKATTTELTEAKNRLAKIYHPDANIQNDIDTTEKMQEILEAYALLSDPESRAEYDRKISGSSRTMQTFDLHEMRDEATGEDSYPSFLTYWKTASTLNELVTKSLGLFGRKQEKEQLKVLAKQALRCAVVLRNASIPEKYWHPEAMNWLLFIWNQNRNFSTSYLLTLYEEHLRTEKKTAARLRQKGRCRTYQRQVKKLIRY